MADDKRGRDKRARDDERRQRERAILEELERGSETEPPVDETDLADLRRALDRITFPATGQAIVEAVGDQPLDAGRQTHTLAELLPETDAHSFETRETVRMRVQRPTIAAAMKRIAEAAAEQPTTALDRSQRLAYEKTLRALEAIDADDQDEGVDVLTDWIVERIHERGAVPNSRAVRRRAATFCRTNGYTVRDDEWLGV
jgi:hypothetical protein